MEIKRWHGDRRYLDIPVGYEPGTKVPLVLQIHGGPAGVFYKIIHGKPIHLHDTIFCSRGDCCARPNPRGSTGYSKEFRYANFKDWGFGDYEDVMSGVDKVIEMGVADEKRMTVMGWSYGGYLTSFLVTRTNRFKAASMGAGLPNLVSMTTTTDIPDYLVGHMGGEVWNDYDTTKNIRRCIESKNVTIQLRLSMERTTYVFPFTQGQEFLCCVEKKGGAYRNDSLAQDSPRSTANPKLLMEVSHVF